MSSDQPSRYVVGIDLGTTNCALAYIDTGSGEDASAAMLPIPQVTQQGQVEPREQPEPFGGVADLGGRGAGLRERLARRPLEQLHQQVVFTAEIQVDRAGRDSCRACDVGDLGIEKPALGEDVDGGAQDGVALRDEDRIGAFSGGNRGRRGH